MPYIHSMRREAILQGEPATCAGELNFDLTITILDYWKQHQTYQGINDIIGALEGAKAEFQRRIVAPYEDQKIGVNGDVYS